MSSVNGSGFSASGRRLEVPPRSPSTDRLSKTNSFKSPLASGGESFWKTNFRNLEQKQRTQNADYSRSLGLGEDDEEGTKHNENYQTNFSLPPRNKGLKKPPSPHTPMSQGRFWEDRVQFGSSSKLESHDSVEQEMQHHGSPSAKNSAHHQESGVHARSDQPYSPESNSRYSPDQFADSHGTSPPMSQSELNGSPPGGFPYMSAIRENRNSNEQDNEPQQMHHSQPVRGNRKMDDSEANQQEGPHSGPVGLPAPKKKGGALPPIQSQNKKQPLLEKRDPLLQPQRDDRFSTPEQVQNPAEHDQRRSRQKRGYQSRRPYDESQLESGRDKEEAQWNRQQYSQRVPVEDEAAGPSAHRPQRIALDKDEDSSSDNEEENVRVVAQTEDDAQAYALQHHESWTERVQEMPPQGQPIQGRGKRKSVDEVDTRRYGNELDKPKAEDERTRRKSVEGRQRRKSSEGRERRRSIEDGERRNAGKERVRKNLVEEREQGSLPDAYPPRGKNAFQSREESPERKSGSGRPGRGSGGEPSTRTEEGSHRPLYPVSSFSHNFEPLLFDTDRNTIGSTPMIGISDKLPRHQSLLVRIPMGDGQFMELIEGQYIKRCVLKGWLEKKPHPLLALFKNWSVKYCRVHVHTKVERVPAYNGVGFSLDERVDSASIKFYPDSKLSTDPIDFIPLYGQTAYSVSDEKILSKHPGCFKISNDGNESYYAPASSESGKRVRKDLIRLGRLWKRAINAAVNSKGRLFVEKFKRSSESGSSKA
eukprot:gb/GECG01009296.1/.p1 GENE.gb/GECG01009296.1/~~gb/GECG01009296.1/.p1  ORF type:complete len:760 (+),score=114.32 gb/GECG01009296.1/:1-2280(+)